VEQGRGHDDNHADGRTDERLDPTAQQQERTGRGAASSAVTLAGTSPRRLVGAAAGLDIVGDAYAIDPRELRVIGPASDGGRGYRRQRGHRGQLADRRIAPLTVYRDPGHAPPSIYAGGTGRVDRPEMGVQRHDDVLTG
jgi:hypothetical protein